MSPSPDADPRVDDPIIDDVIVIDDVIDVVADDDDDTRSPSDAGDGDRDLDRIDGGDDAGDPDAGRAEELVLDDLEVARPGGAGRAGAASSLARHTRSALSRIVSGPSRATPGPEVDPVRRHRAEYREPSIWVWRRIVGTAFAFIIVTLAWYLLKVPDGLIADDTLPSQTQVATAFNELRADGFAGVDLVDHVAASLARLVIGALVGLGLGGMLGLAVGSAPLGRTIIDPITSLLGMVPAMAIGPLAIVWLGPGEAGIVGAVAATVLWTTTDAVATVRVRDLRAVRPDLAHELAQGVRRALSAGWAAVLAIETLLAPIGLGPMLWSAQGQVDVIVAGIYIVGLVGLAVDTLPRIVEYLVVNGAPAERRAVRARHPAARSIAVRGGSVAGSG